MVHDSELRQEYLKWAQHCVERSPGRLQRAPRERKTTRRWLTSARDVPRRLQDCPPRAKRGSKRAPQGHKKAPTRAHIARRQPRDSNARASPWTLVARWRWRSGGKKGRGRVAPR
eukprot:1750704-Pyramimonas_sp.AAC.1